MCKKVRARLIKAMCIALILTFLVPSGGVDAATKFKTYKKTTTSGGAIKAKGYDYSKAVPKNGTQEMSYFKDAAFFGDSRAVDLFIYTKIPDTGAKAYCDIGLNCKTVSSKKFVSQGGKKVTALTNLKKNKKKIKKVYLMFGLNELTWNVDTFISRYKKLINQIRDITPNAIIYVQNIIPVSKAEDKDGDDFNNKRIKKFNKKIKEMCKVKRVFLLDAYSATVSSKGYLPSSANAGDGIHFTPKFSKSRVTYLRKRTVVIEK